MTQKNGHLDLGQRTFNLTRWQTIGALALVICGGGLGYMGGWFTMPERVTKLETGQQETHDAVIELKTTMKGMATKQDDFMLELRGRPPMSGRVEQPGH